MVEYALNHRVVVCMMVCTWLWCSPIAVALLLSLKIQARLPRSSNHIANRLSLTLKIQSTTTKSEYYVMRNEIVGAAVTPQNVIQR